jgi:hypothetical protein
LNTLLGNTCAGAGLMRRCRRDWHTCGYALADAIDGWRCKGMQAGDLALVGDRPGTRPMITPSTGAGEKK